MRALTLRTLALAATLAVPVSAAAQSAEGEPAQAPGWTLTPAVTVGWLWDSNVGMVTEGFGQDIRADHLLLITPSGSATFVGRHTEFNAGYAGTLRRYRDVNELNSFDQRVRVSLAHRANARLLFFGRENFSRLPTTDELELNGVPFRRTGSRLNSATGGIEARFTKFTTLRAAYEFINVDFDHERVLPTFVLGGRSHGVTADLSRRTSERIAFGVLYEVRFAQIKTQLGTDEPLRFQIMGGSTTWALTPMSRLTLAGGVSTLSDPSLNDTSIGPFLRAGFQQHFERATLNLGYERSFVPTFGFAASTQTEQIFGSLLMPVARNRAYLQATTAWRRNNPLLENEPALTSFYLSTTAGYALARTVRVEGFYTTSWQDTRVAGGQVNRHRLGAQLVLLAPVRVP